MSIDLVALKIDFNSIFICRCFQIHFYPTSLQRCQVVLFASFKLNYHLSFLLLQYCSRVQLCETTMVINIFSTNKKCAHSFFLAWEHSSHEQSFWVRCINQMMNSRYISKALRKLIVFKSFNSLWPNADSAYFVVCDTSASDIAFHKLEVNYQVFFPVLVLKEVEW